MIHARGLVQTFQTREGKKKTQVRAVDGVDLDVAEGEVVGFLGPNGAGKTTTLRMLTTLLRPTEGTATVAGYDVVKESEKVRRSIGHVSQSGSTGQFARAGDDGWPTSVTTGTVDDLHAADAVWLLSGIRGTASVHTLDGVPRGDADLSDRVRTLLAR